MFEKTRLKLTAWYLLIIMFISISFSFIIYKVSTNEFERFAKKQKSQIEYRMQNFSPPPPPITLDPELITEVKKRILLLLTQINLFILIAAGGLGYILAGRTLKPIATMMEEQNRFISDASHELRTPLTALKTSMEVNLRDKNLTLEDAKKIINHNIDQVNKLQILSDNLLELARNENNSNRDYLKNTSLKKIVNETIEKLTPLAQKKQILIKKKLIDADIKGSRDNLINLFTILLDNAIKYSPNKSRITIGMKKTNKTVDVFVEDQGIGIDKKDIPYIFDRFYRADQARSKSHTDGYGLGLSIAKKIVKEHNGIITVKSKDKKGTVFQVSFSMKS